MYEIQDRSICDSGPSFCTNFNDLRHYLAVQDDFGLKFGVIVCFFLSKPHYYSKLKISQNIVGISISEGISKLQTRMFWKNKSDDGFQKLKRWIMNLMAPSCGNGKIVFFILSLENFGFCFISLKLLEFFNF